MDVQWMLVIGIVLIVIVLAAAVAWIYAKKIRSQRLKTKFGPEYHRTVQRMGSREIAENELEEREQRVRRFNIVPLSPQDCSYYQDRWTAVQGRFVDDPKGAVEEAHQLVDEVMKKRGYPVIDIERSAANLSVEYPAVINHYRVASLIAEKNRKGTAQTEELRQAVVNYRSLFEELLERAEAAKMPRRKSRIELNRIFRGGLPHEDER
jgi:hypothetical protein